MPDLTRETFLQALSNRTIDNLCAKGFWNSAEVLDVMDSSDLKVIEGHEQDLDEIANDDAAMAEVADAGKAKEAAQGQHQFCRCPSTWHSRKTS